MHVLPCIDNENKFKTNKYCLCNSKICDKLLIIIIVNKCINIQSSKGSTSMCKAIRGSIWKFLKSNFCSTRIKYYSNYRQNKYLLKYSFKLIFL